MDPANDALLRNAGTARERQPGEDGDVLDLESAIARNTKRLRAQLGLSVGDMAARVGISKAMLSKVENAQTSCSLSTLALLARGFDVPVTTLVRGAESERPASFVAAGQGAPIVRRGTQRGHEYQLLGSLPGEHKRLESLLVTLNAASELNPLFQHPGTEFIYVLSGEMVYGHGRSSYRLGPGDSLQFDGEGAHGPLELVTLPVTFLSVIAFPDATL
ncbi:helix-turn-helix domain-containing protein [Nocardioides flavescens]|uniref:Helix-turn-helix domain-containing protein n=1 Tax=Nocardioides flavescens TaxID=2691959 RepID=A0A6L7ERA5_9ACTN|nr:helix-turn-helix domain-containing protein [Nocardioides flavescens]